MINEDDNWLDAKVFDCPNCNKGLFTVGHSPFADDDSFYCNACPKRVEISFYDKLRRDLSKQLDGGSLSDLIPLIENELKPCNCGGTFKYQSPRRCIYCSIVIIGCDNQYEIYPSYFKSNSNRKEEPTESEIARVKEFQENFIITKNFWK
jgi:hypothetical protein